MKRTIVLTGNPIGDFPGIYLVVRVVRMQLFHRTVELNQVMVAHAAPPAALEMPVPDVVTGYLTPFRCCGTMQYYVSEFRQGSLKIKIRAPAPDLPLLFDRYGRSFRRRELARS